jgi:hypothetical protein
MDIYNREMHRNTALKAEPFGDTGAIHLTPIRGERPGDSFILDAHAAEELADFITDLQR